MMMRAPRLLSLALVMSSATLVSCTEDPSDVDIEDVITDLVLEGRWEARTGLVIEFNADGHAIVVKFGDSVLGTNSSVFDIGDTFIRNITRVDHNTWSAEVLDTETTWSDFTPSHQRLVSYTWTTGELEINEHTDNLYVGGYTWDFDWERLEGTLPPPDDDDDDDTPSADIVLLYNKMLEGDNNSSTFFTITVPSGTKKLVVETFEEDQWGHNLGDLFVSRGQRPAVHGEEPYRWTADCASVKPNREREVCSFNNPPAGTWHILLYGYHAYYSTSLKATISK